MSPASIALMRRARMGLLISATARVGSAGDQFAFWCGYAKALRDLSRGAGDALAEKDAALPYQPLGGFDRAAECLHQDIETLSRVQVQQLLAHAGIQVPAHAVPGFQLSAPTQFEDGAVARVDTHGEHAAPGVAGGDHSIHGGSVATAARMAEGGAR